VKQAEDYKEQLRKTHEHYKGLIAVMEQKHRELEAQVRDLMGEVRELNARNQKLVEDMEAQQKNAPSGATRARSAPS